MTTIDKRVYHDRMLLRRYLQLSGLCVPTEEEKDMVLELRLEVGQEEWFEVSETTKLRCGRNACKSSDRGPWRCGHNSFQRGGQLEQGCTRQALGPQNVADARHRVGGSSGRTRIQWRPHARCRNGGGGLRDTIRDEAFLSVQEHGQRIGKGTHTQM